MKQPTARRPREQPTSLWSRFGKLADMYAYPLRAAHYVELVNPLWTTHKLQARVERIWDETKDARTLSLRPGLNWRRHRAGQHLRVGVAVDGLQYTRTYTISSPPERPDGCITITAKVIAGGRVSPHVVRRIKVGDYLPIGLPQGDFCLPNARPVLPLFITAGSGITPAMSMLRSKIAQDRLPRTVHIHYAPHEFDVIFGKELVQTASEQPLYTLHQILTHEYGELKQTKGYFSAEQLERLCPDWREREVYVCGPPGLMKAVEAHFERAGLSRRLHTERFLATFAEVPDDAIGGRVSFRLSGVQADADAQTPLLRVAELAGMNPPHGCRMGICRTCDTMLLSGCVRDLRSGKLLNEAGSVVQTCICAAAGDCELQL